MRAARIVAVVLAALAGAALAAETNLFNVATNVASGTNRVDVTWTNVLAAPPTLILAGVRAPNATGTGSFRMWANPIKSSVETNGLTVELSGRTDTTGYVVTVSIWE